MYALDNEDATLECYFTGHPPPKITWMQDDEIIHSDDHFVISVDHKEGKTSLTVKGVTYDDIGEYECIAVNDKGYADCRLYLDVAGRKQSHNGLDHIYVASFLFTSKIWSQNLICCMIMRLRSMKCLKENAVTPN